MERFVLRKDAAIGGDPKHVTQGDLEQWGLRDIKLRGYQLEGLNWMLQHYAPGRGCILADEMGLGKTLQSIALILYLLKGKKCDGPILVLCPLSVIINWENEITRFTPCLKLVDMSVSKDERQQLRSEISTKQREDTFNVMLGHYDMVYKDIDFLLKFKWQCVVVDEAHRLKNPNSKLYTLLQKMNTQYRLLLTGTPVQNRIGELYSLLSFTAPSVFKISRLDEFCQAFSNLEDVDVTAELHRLLQPYLLRRVKSEVLLDLPERSEVTLYTGMTSLQKKLYKSILLKDTSVFGEAGSRTSLMNVLMQLRKCCNHPYLFDGVEAEPFQLGEHLVETSGKFLVLDKLLDHLKSHDHRVLIFSQMTRMLDIVQDYLGYRGYSYERLDGSVRGEERFLSVKKFNEDDEVFIFLLSTRAGGQGLNLATADTVVFLDSDYNPQNDLQAAARAHRLGQKKPVKIIRLVSQHSVEDIILNRATAKLKLSSTVIAEGQFTHGTVGSSAGLGSEKDICEILKFGLSTLLESADSSVTEQIDIESILGPTCNGCWTTPVEPATMATEDKPSDGAPESMYVYEGEDYSKLCSENDKKSFDQLLAEQLKVVDDDKILRSRHHVLSPSVLAIPSQRKRKQLTPEELEQRKQKREENRLKKLKLLEEAEQKKLADEKRKRMEYWKRTGYTSLNVVADSDSEEALSDGDDDIEEEWSGEINYVRGDVTHPHNVKTEDIIIVHCVDDSGRWGKGGLFEALSARSTQPQVCYEQAGKMRDLSLGDAHIIPIDDLQSRAKGRDMLALIVAQSRGRDGRLSPIKLSALSDGLKKVAIEAKRMKASVHLPRIGHSTPHFNWYGTERLIRKHLVMKRIPTYIYYFARVKKVKKTHVTGSAASASTPPKTQADDEVVVPLQDIFTDCVFYFHEWAPDEQRKWTRHIVGHNGIVSDTMTDTVTHVIVTVKCLLDRSQLPAIRDGATPPVMVMSNWIEDCLHKQMILDTATYNLNASLNLF